MLYFSVKNQKLVDVKQITFRLNVVVSLFVN